MQAPNIDDVLRKAAEAGEVPGVVAMAATTQGLIYEGAFGKRWLPDGPPLTIDTVFWIASMTKAITSAAAMLLVERGKLGLDNPIGDVLPELAVPLVLEGFGARREPKLRRAKREITLRQLLTHTSGFGYDFLNPDLLRYREEMGIPEIMSCKDAALNMPLTFDPGERWEYGMGIDWAGKAIERVSGQKLEAYFYENLFGPLAMKDTAFKLTAERRTRLAGMHARQSNGSLEPIPFEIPQEPEFQMGGGGLYSTAADYLAFEQMFLRDGRSNGDRLLRSETVRLMGQNHIGELQVATLKSVVPAYSNDAEFFPGMVKKWGLAFMINTEPVPGSRSANSLAWAGMANTYYWIDPIKQVAGVILTQVLPFFDSNMLGLFDQFEKAIYAALA